MSGSEVHKAGKLLLHPSGQTARQTLDKGTERRHFHQLRIALAPLVDARYTIQIRVEVKIFLNAEIWYKPNLCGM